MRLIFVLALALVCLARAAAADLPPPDSAPPGLLCRHAIAAAARIHDIPPALMAAIGRVESGRRDPVSGVQAPWPWTVDDAGQGAFYDTKAQAVAAVRGLQARGVRSIDVGCMQVNLMHHPDAFASLELAFDPNVNADYAARFLRTLLAQTGSWPKAAAMYHSATPELAAEYQRKVMAAWPEEQRLADGGQTSALASAWAATLGPVGVPPPRRGLVARIIPMAGAGGAMPAGRGLDAYRAAPVMLARPPARG